MDEQQKWTDDDVKRLAKALRKEIGSGCPVFSSKMILALKVIAYGSIAFGGGLMIGIGKWLIDNY